MEDELLSYRWRLLVDEEEFLRLQKRIEEICPGSEKDIVIDPNLGLTYGELKNLALCYLEGSCSFYHYSLGWYYADAITTALLLNPNVYPQKCREIDPCIADALAQIAKSDLLISYYKPIIKKYIEENTRTHFAVSPSTNYVKGRVRVNLSHEIKDAKLLKSKFDTVNFKEIHKSSSCSRQKILPGEKCGCFNCARIFAAEEISWWEDEERTPICPFCGIDSVINKNACGHEVTMELLFLMSNIYFFGWAGPEIFELVKIAPRAKNKRGGQKIEK